MASRSSPDKIAAAQDRALAKYVRREVYPYSAFNRARLEDSGLGAAGVRTRSDLRRLPAAVLPEVGDGRDAVLRPDRDAVISYGRVGLVGRMVWASGWGRHGALLRKVVEPRYRPVQWSLAGGVPIGASQRDLDRLALLGESAFDLLGIGRGDVVVAVGLAPADLATLELGAGARRGGIGWLPLAPASAGSGVRVAPLRPVALVGPRADVAATLEAEPALSSLRQIIVTDGPLVARRREALQTAAGGSSVVVAWAPPGVRSLWVECQAGAGLHTWPGAEVVESESNGSGGDGELLWSPIGWAGTVVLRMRTGYRGRVDPGECRLCGQVLPRVHIELAEPMDELDGPRPKRQRTRRATPLRAPTRARSAGGKNDIDG